MPQYVELHAQSAFSFLEAASSPEQLARRCADLDLSAMALNDANGVYGSARFHYACRKLGVRAIVGAEVGIGTGQRLTLLVETQQGYRNLCQLITRTKLRHGRNGKIENPIALPEELALYSEGLVCLTGGDEGPLAHALRDESNGVDAARSKLEELVRLFGPQNVYSELQRHRRRDQEKRNEAALELAEVLKLPLLATNGVRFARPENRPLQDVLTCLRHKTTLADAGRLILSMQPGPLRCSDLAHLSVSCEADGRSDLPQIPIVRCLRRPAR